VSEGAFREDLHFRIAVLPVTVPPVRERLDDLPLLALAFLPPQEHAAVTPALLDSLRARPWRGNVRELQNFVEREYMRGVLARTGGNVSAAAEAAGLDRAYVYRLIRKHDL
jgi:transcriptional regulator with PAS, ATPase and Fis domain